MAGAGSLYYPLRKEDVDSQLDFWSNLIFKDLMCEKLKWGTCYRSKECETDHGYI